MRKSNCLYSKVKEKIKSGFEKIAKKRTDSQGKISNLRDGAREVMQGGGRVTSDIKMGRRSNKQISRAICLVGWMGNLINTICKYFQFINNRLLNL